MAQELEAFQHEAAARQGGQRDSAEGGGRTRAGAEDQQHQDRQEAERQPHPGDGVAPAVGDLDGPPEADGGDQAEDDPQAVLDASRRGLWCIRGIARFGRGGFANADEERRQVERLAEQAVLPGGGTRRGVRAIVFGWKASGILGRVSGGVAHGGCRLFHRAWRGGGLRGGLAMKWHGRLAHDSSYRAS